MNRQPYATDLTNEQYAKVAPFVETSKTGRTGRPRKYSHREILNAIFYQLRCGGAWRHLPHDFPHWLSVYAYFRLWSEDGTLERIHAALRKAVRQQAGKAPDPTAVILDSQSVKTTEKGGKEATTRASRSTVGSAISL
jgi:transposase